VHACAQLGEPAFQLVEIDSIDSSAQGRHVDIDRRDSLCRFRRSSHDLAYGTDCEIDAVIRSGQRVPRRSDVRAGRGSDGEL